MNCRLIAHPDTPPVGVTGVEVEIVKTDPDDILLRYFVYGSNLLLPEWTVPRRADDLWQTTCFELFLRNPGSGACWEYNFSPSTQWAAYRFHSYRQGREDMKLDVNPFIDRQPSLELADREPHYALDAELDLGGLPNLPLSMNLAAVIEETNGRKSYWALAHPPGDPDFHHPDCFVLELPPPDRA